MEVDEDDDLPGYVLPRVRWALSFRCPLDVAHQALHSAPGSTGFSVSSI